MRMDLEVSRIGKLAVEMLSRPTCKHLEELRGIVQDSDKTTLQEYQKVLIFPLVNIFRKHSSSVQLVEMGLQILCAFLERSSITSWIAFKDIAGCLCVLPQKLKETKKDDPAVSIGIIQAMATLLSTTDPSVLWCGFDISNIQLTRVLWSHMILQSVEVCGKESSRQEKITALHLIQNLVLSSSEVSEQQAALCAIFATCFPGVCTACYGLITNVNSSGFVGHEVLVQSLTTLELVICLVLNDLNCGPFLPEIKPFFDMYCLNDINGSVDAAQKNDQAVASDEGTSLDPRSAKWLQETVSKLQLILERLSFLTSNEAVDVRIAFCRLSAGIVRRCFRTLKSVLPMLIRNAVVLSEDDHPNVAEFSAVAIQDISLHIQVNGTADDIWDQLQGDFINLFDCLPLTARSYSPEKLDTALKTILGCMRIFDARVGSFLAVGDLSDRLLDSLVDVCEIDVNMFDLMGFSEDLCRFKLLMECSSVRLFREICRRLGKFELQLNLSQILLDRLSAGTTPARSNEQLFILVSLLDGFMESRNDLTEESVLPILEYFVSSDLWRYTSSTHGIILSNMFLTNQPAAGFADNSSFSDLKKAVIGLCLIMEGISKISQFLTENFIPHLNSCFYLLLSKKDSEMPIIQQSAILSLEAIAVSCGYPSIDRLVVSNFEYLVNAVVLRVRNLRRHPEAVLVLRVVMAYASPEVLPLLLKIISVVVAKMDEMCHMAALPFVIVLRAVIQKFAEWFSVAEIARLDEPKKGGMEFAIEYLRKAYSFGDLGMGTGAEKVMDTDGDGNLEDTNDEEMDLNDKMPDIPEYIKSTVEVVRRCAYLLPQDDRHLRSAILDVLRDGCRILRPYREQLLPIIHKMWQSIIMLHRTDDFVVIRKAFECLCEMSRVANTFLSHRVCTEILPIIVRFLGKEADNCLKSKFKAKEERTSVSTQLKLIFLRNLGEMLVNLKADEKAYLLVINSSVFFLDVRHLMELQEACLELFLQLSYSQPDMVLIKMLKTKAEFPDICFGKNWEQICRSTEAGRRFLEKRQLDEKIRHEAGAAKDDYLTPNSD